MHRSPLTTTPVTLTNYCGYQRNGIRISVVYPYQGAFAVANHSYGGRPIIFKTLDAAKASCELRNPSIAYWQQEEVPQ